MTEKIHIPRWNELPSLDLYMDQIVTYIDDALALLAGVTGTVPVTKSMVNNYVKARIVSPPVNKKYPKVSVAMIIVVCILKSCFSTDEISRLIRFGLQLDEIPVVYDRFCEAIENAVQMVFSGEIHVNDMHMPGRESKYLMDNFALVFASKFYVQHVFLSESE